MSDTVLVLKDEHNQKPIPTVWRSTLSSIVDEWKAGDFGLTRGVAGVRPITAEKAAKIAASIKSYGAQLTSLPEETWQTSVCQWMGDYWDVMVDLYTEEEGSSDLVLAVRVYEEGSAYAFDVHFAYVP